MCTMRKRVDEKNLAKGEKILSGVALFWGIICIAYFVGIVLFTGPGSNFYFIWLLMGIVLVIYFIMDRTGFIAITPLWIKRIVSCFLMVGIVIFLLVEGLIISGFNEKGKEGLDYIIVLGAQLKPSGPSRVLKMRLDEAYDYLIENPETRVIVSGGQGSNEPDSEAQGMYDYLVRLGIEGERIIKEDLSTSTVENLTYSSGYIDIENCEVGIVTNNFHVFRAVKLAKKIGYKEVYGISAPSYLFLQPNNMLREFCGIVKDFVFGNM